MLNLSFSLPRSLGLFTSLIFLLLRDTHSYCTCVRTYISFDGDFTIEKDQCTLFVCAKIVHTFILSLSLNFIRCYVTVAPLALSRHWMLIQSIREIEGENVCLCAWDSSSYIGVLIPSLPYTNIYIQQMVLFLSLLIYRILLLMMMNK